MTRVLLAVYFIEWGFYYFSDSATFWTLILCSKQFSLALAVTLAYRYSSGERAALVYLCCVCWVDFVLDLIWATGGVGSNGLIAPALLLGAWAGWVLFRPATCKSDPIDPKKVSLLLLQPRGFKSTVKGFFGLPFTSVCIYADGFVWSFRTDKNAYCQTKFSDKWIETHAVVTTGVETTKPLLDELKKLLGTRRGVGVKCVYVIRDILKLLGPEWAPRTAIQLIPGFYALQIFRGQGCLKK